MLKIAYSFFIGILLAIFVGVGIQAFYEPPKHPEPTDYGVEYSAIEPDSEQQEAQKELDRAWQEHDKSMKPYNRNVSIITLVAAVAFLAASLSIAGKKFNFLSDGFMLGGVFTLLYSLGRSFAAQDSQYTFVVITVGLVVAIVLGYKRFLEPSTKKK